MKAARAECSFTSFERTTIDDMGRKVGERDDVDRVAGKGSLGVASKPSDEPGGALQLDEGMCSEQAAHRP
jgi:hypothetical protein